MRFLGNANTKEVHDLDNQQTGCQIDEIVRSTTFSPDTLAQAKAQGYDPCSWCLDGSTS